MPNNDRLYTLDGLLRQGIYDDAKQAFVPVETVLVPKIQRPYAQGRLSQTEVRDNFLDDLFLGLTRTDETLELNFVYGSMTDGTFELLDGQQRLTTLFLLAWYLALYDGDRERIMELLGKFTYETRTTSISFIKKLIDKKLTLDKIPKMPFAGTTPQNFISKLGWYTGAYSKDSTVTGMLVMLDDIHRKFMAIPDASHPTYADLDRIRFYLLDLDNLGLTDELFIKMNARGLQLTPFENFKAELSGWLKSDPFADGRYEQECATVSGKLPFWLFFCSSMDGRWNDLFWTVPGESDNIDDLGASEADRGFFTFLKRWLANRAVTLGQEDDNSDNTDWYYYFKYFSDKSKTNRYHSFSTFKEFVTAANARGFDIIAELTQTLSAFSRIEAIDDAFTAPWAGQSQKPWDRNFEMRPMIIFSAISAFILTQPYDSDAPLEFSDFDLCEFRRWMRIVHNVVENRNIDSERVQLATTRQLKDVLGFNTKPVYIRLLDYMGASTRDSNREFREEAAKIQRIISDKDWQNGSLWEEAFKEAEKDQYMTGSVSFYLDDATDVDTFRKRTSRVPLLFNAEGVEAAFRHDYILWRAILARDTNWSAFKPDTYNIRITNRVSGNRHLKTRTIWNEAPAVRRLFRDLLDKNSIGEMTSHLNSVAEESNPMTFPDSWSDEIRALSEMGLAALRSYGRNGGAMGWFASLSWLDTIGVWFNRNGVMALFRGNVNCMYLNNYREQFIPALEKILADNGFTIAYCDPRFKESYDRFGLYSGLVIDIVVSRQIEEVYLLHFTPHFGLEVYAASEMGDITFPNIERVHIGDELLDENRNRRTYSVNVRLFRLAAYVSDIREIDPLVLLLPVIQ